MYYMYIHGECHVCTMRFPCSCFSCRVFFLPTEKSVVFRVQCTTGPSTHARHPAPHVHCISRPHKLPLVCCQITPDVLCLRPVVVTTARSPSACSVSVSVSPGLGHAVGVEEYDALMYRHVDTQLTCTDL